MIKTRTKKTIGKKVATVLLIIAICIIMLVAAVGVVLYLNSYKIDIQLIGEKDVVIEYGEKYVDSGATAFLKGKFFSKSGKEVEVVTHNDVDDTKLGAYTVRYTADITRRHAEIERTVTVVDTQAPTLAIRGDTEIVLTRGNKYTEPGFEAKDNYDGDISSLVTVSGEVDTSKTGEYILTYNVSDSSGNTVTASRKVTVKAPVVAKPVLPTTIYPGEKTIYLTFDDGPSKYTGQLLDVLKKYNVKATFFVIKTSNTDTLKRMADEGHAIGLHTATHDYEKIYSSESAFFADLDAVQKVVVDKTGKKSNLIRFPGGSSNLVSSFNPGIMTRLTAAVTQNGYRYFDWNVDSKDAGGATSSAQVVTNVTNGVAKRDVSVVLQHDTKKYSIDAVEEIIKWGLENGYTFKALDETSPKCQHGVQN